MLQIPDVKNQIYEGAAIVDVREFALLGDMYGKPVIIILLL
jgi:hypothetical protein